MVASAGGCKAAGLDRSALQARKGQKVDGQGTNGNNEGADSANDKGGDDANGRAKKTAGTKKVAAQYKKAPTQKRRKQILMLLPTHAKRFNFDCMGNFFYLFFYRTRWGRPR